MELNRNFETSKILGNLNFYEANIYKYLIELCFKKDEIRLNETKLFSIYFKIFINLIYLFKSNGKDMDNIYQYFKLNETNLECDFNNVNFQDINQL